MGGSGLVKEKIGFTIGKFAPFHQGHEFLIRSGMKNMDRFYVVLYETDLVPFSLETRASWIRQTFPEVTILLAYHPPCQYGLDDQSVKIQTQYLKQILGDIPVTHFFSSEPYGHYVAKELQVEDCRVDMERHFVPISATSIRQNPTLAKQYLNTYAYLDYQRWLSC